MSPDEYVTGSDRVAEHLAEQHAPVRRWDAPPADEQQPEAERGYDDGLTKDITDVAARCGHRVRRITLAEPEHLSPTIAELYRWWHRRRGKFGGCVADWLRDRDLGGVILVGHSSGTQVAARAAVGHPDVVGVVLASPTVDPIARSLPRLLLRWRLDSRHEPSGLSENHRPEWKRAGIRRMLHIAQVHRADKLEESVALMRVPLLVIRGREDRISTARWGRQLADLVPDGRYIEVPGAHTFPWLVPDAWSRPVREPAAAAGRV